MFLAGEIKDAKMSSFSCDFQTLIRHYFPLYFLYELLMSLSEKMACYMVSVLHNLFGHKKRGGRFQVKANMVVLIITAYLFHFLNQ